MSFEGGILVANKNRSLRQCDRHSNPADELLLAQVYQRLDEPEQARKTLEQMLLCVDDAPPIFSNSIANV